MSDLDSKFWLALALTVPIAMLVNLASPGLGAPVVVTFAILWFLAVGLISQVPKYRKWKAEQTRKGREKEFFRLMEEIDAVTTLHNNPSQLTAYSWGIFWSFLSSLKLTAWLIALILIIYALVDRVILSRPINEAFDPYTAVVIIAIFSLTFLGNNSSARLQVFRHIINFEDYLNTTRQNLKHLYDKDQVNYLFIHSARFGTDSDFIDLTYYLRKRIVDNKLEWRVGTNPFEFDDPAPGQPKMVSVDYSSGLVRQLTLQPEDATLRLPNLGDADQSLLNAPG